MRTNAFASFLLVGALGVGAAGCVVRGSGYVSTPAVATVEVYEDPPPPRYVQVTPRAGYVWIDGRWDYRGGRYVWLDGRWERERSGYAYTQGYWQRRGRGHVWVEGRWSAGGSVRRDRDRDGVPNRYDRDRDGDGIRNRNDRHPNRPGPESRDHRNGRPGR